MAVLYILVTELLIQPWVLGSQSMAPSYPRGARLVVMPYLLRNSSGLRNPPERGDLVTIHPPYVKSPSWIARILHPLVRFVSFQAYSPGKGFVEEWEDGVSFKRVIAVPGDTVKMENFVAYVKSASSDFFLSEFEMSGIGYDIQAPKLPPGWGPDLPLSGTIPPLQLQEGEYFVLGDNRGASNDSRYWGALEEEAINSRVLFAYWPPKSFGLPR
ncbi:MAG: signal peptidase I [Spirochaetales bacterium]|nr:signal peptidase I [Spirochaetales bacterium]